MVCVKAEELRRLAREFRLKAKETCMNEYIALMTRSADELDRLADETEAHDREYCATANVQPLRR
jgi:hypothetical protein